MFWSVGSPGFWNNPYFDENAATGALLIPIGKNKPSYAELNVLNNVWIKKNPLCLISQLSPLIIFVTPYFVCTGEGKL